MTFTSTPQTIDFTATMETENGTEEEALFMNLDNTRATFSPADANGDGGNEVSRVNGTQPMGIGLALPVEAGDTLDLQVNAYYEGGTGYSSSVGLAALVSAIAGGFGGLNGGTAEQQATYDAFNNSVGTYGLHGTGSNTIPAAYLNYILFDENLNDYQNGHVQVSTAASFNHELLQLNDIVASQDGFVYVFLTNESASSNWVYFDDMVVKHTQGDLIIQTDDYYPFGLTFNSYNRVTATENSYKYQGKELLDDLDLGVYDFHARMYDPALGKTFQQDPLGEMFYDLSPYNWAVNNPISFVDPTGMFSTHTDSTGNVVAVYNDGDNGVYRHDNLPDTYAETENDSGDRLNAEDGEYMGETEYWDEFRGHDNETGEVEDYVNGTIMFGESWNYDLFSLNLDARKMGLELTALESIPRGDFDIKVNRNIAEKGPSTGKLLNGKYATARSAGNYLAGLNAATATNVFGDYVTKEGFMKLAGHLHAFGNSNGAPYYGEIPVAGRMIDSGYQAGLRIRNRELRKKK